MYPNHAAGEFYPLGSEGKVTVEDKGNGIYEITLDPNSYLSGASVRFFTEALPYDGQFIPCFDGEKEGTSVTWTEGGEEPAELESGAYVDFTVNKSQTFTVTAPSEDGFYGIEAFYADPKDGADSVFVSASSEGIVHDEAKHTWTVELFDGKGNTPVSGYWLHVYWSEEEYNYEHLTDGNWSEDSVLVTVYYFSYLVPGSVTVDGRTGYSRYGETRYLVPKTDLASGLPLTVVPAENHYLRYLGINNGDYAGQVENGHLTYYDWNGNDTNINVGAGFEENFEDLGEHITIRDTRITGKAGETFTAHLYLELDEDCGYTWAAAAPEGLGEAVRLFIPGYGKEPEIIYWYVSEENPRLLELKLTGVCNQICSEYEISVTVIRGLLDSASEPVTGGELRSHYNSNALWNILAEEGMTIKSGTSIKGVYGVFTDPQEFVLKLNDGYKWSEDIRIQVNKRGWIYANCQETSLEFVSVSEDRTELTVRLSGRSAARDTWPIIFWAASGCVLDKNNKTVEQILATEQREDINWTITNRSGLTVEAVLNGRARESKSQTITLKLDEESGLTFNATELSTVDGNKADLKNYISFNGNPGWWTFTDYELVSETELRVTFDLYVPYKRIHDPLNVFVDKIISGNATLAAEGGQDAYWNIRPAGWTFGLTGMEYPTGILFGEEKTFTIDRDGYEGQIKVEWSMEGSGFDLTEEGESAIVKARTGESAEAVLVANVSYDYDSEREIYRSHELLNETVYVKNSFNYSGLEADVNVLEKNHTIHAVVENPSGLTVNSVTWEVLPLENGEADTRITVAPKEGKNNMEAVVHGAESTGSGCAKLKVTVAYELGDGTQTTESCTASVNVYDKTENTFKITYDSNGGTGVVASQYVKAGEKVKVRDITFTKEDAFAECWTDADGNCYYEDDTFIPQADMTLKASWMKKGWCQEDGVWYYYDSSGFRCCGQWVEDKGASYWLDYDNGARTANSRVEWNGVPFCTDGNGAMIKNGWGLDVRDHVTSPMYLTDAGVALGVLGEETACIDGKYYSFENGWAWTDYVINLQVGEEENEEDDYIVYLLDGNPARAVLPVPEKEGYRFDGWYTESTGGEKVEDKDLEGIAADSRLYAHWTAVTKAEVIIIYKEQSLENPAVYVEAARETITGIVGDKTAVTAPERIGFTAEEEIEQQSITAEGTVVEVLYTRDRYAFEYTSKIGSECVEYYYYGETIDLPEEEPYQEEGKTFLGWYQGSERFQEGDTMPASDVELTPLWAEGEWVWDGIGWKYADPWKIYGSDGAADKQIGIPEEDPEFWYYVDEYGYMVQNYVAWLEDGIAAYGADGKRLYDSWITVPASYNDFTEYGLTERTGYADEHGWLITGQLKEIGGVTYGFDGNGFIVLGYADESLDMLSGEDCINSSVYYFNSSAKTGTYGAMVQNEFLECTEYHHDYENYEHVFLYFGSDGRKLKDTEKSFTESEGTIRCTFDAKGVLSSGVTVTYARGYVSERTTKMDDRFIPVYPGMTEGAYLDGNLYDYYGWYFNGWKSGETDYADRSCLSADTIKAIYNTEGQKLELTAQWQPIQWKVKLPELENGTIVLSGDSTRKTGTKVTFTITPDSGYHVVEETLGAVELSWIGQEKRTAEDKPVTVSLTKESAANTWSFTMPVSNVRIDAVIAASDGVKYTVECWYQGLDGKYARKDEETKVFYDGVTGEVPRFPQYNAKKGFYPPAALESIPVAGDGSTVYKYEYPRQKLELALTKDEGIASVTGAADSVYFDQEVTVSAAAKTGYHLTGWTYEGTVKSTDASYTFKMPAEEDLRSGDGEGTAPVGEAWTKYELKAESAANTYKVVFNKNSEEAEGTMAEQSFTYDEAAKALTANGFTKTGYTFAGWALTAAGEKKYANQEAVQNLTEDAGGTVNLYAVWTANTYTVKFNGNGGSGEMSDQSFTYDAEAQALTANGFTKTGYTFAGWAETANGTKKYDEGQKLQNLTAEKDGTVNLYAVWTANTYTVKFDANGGSGEMADQSFTYDAEAQALTANAFTKDGYHFAGWAESAEGAVTHADKAAVQNLTAKAGGEVRLYAVWTANSYKVRFSANNGTGTMADQTFTYDAEAQALTANAFTRTGYTFLGWATTGNGEVKYADGAAVKNLTKVKDGEFVLYAKWEAHTYTVKFNGNDTDAEGTMAEQSFTYDEAAKALTANGFTKTGYHFTGWALTEDGAKKYADQEAVQNLTAEKGGTVNLYAVWTANTYTVKFNGNGATAGTMAVESFTYDAEAKELTANAFEKTGYTFAGWAETAAGEKKYDEGQKLQNLTTENGKQIELFAKWTANTYTVKFDANGGSGEMKDQSFTYDETAKALTGNAFTKTGYTFQGWAETANGAKKYADTEAVQNLTAADKAVVTLYAVWKPNTWKVTFDGNNATEGTMAAQSFTYDVEKALTSLGFRRKGYTFSKWTVDEAGEEQAYENRAKVKNLKSGEGEVLNLYAQWTPNEDTAYKVEHQLQPLDGTEYEVDRVEGKYGTTGEQTEAKAKYYEGFEAQPITQDTIAADGSTVVEVKYDRKPYTVDFKYKKDKDSYTVITTQTVKYQGTAAEPEDPKRENYSFAGWYADETYLEGWDFSGNKITEAASIYAKWIPEKKHLTLDANGGTVTPEETYVGYLEYYEGLPTPVRTGYGFAGWYTEAEGGTLVNNKTKVENTDDQTLYAHWVSGRHTVSFQAGEGSITEGSDTMLVEYDDTYGTLPTAERKGYLFLGWYTEKTGGTEITATTIVKITEDQKLYAQYDAEKYTITYEGVDGAENPNPAFYTINDRVDFEKPKKPNYVFAGWDMVLDKEPMGKKMMEPSIRAGKTGNAVMTANWTAYESQQNEVKQSSDVEQQAKESEEVADIVKNISDSSSALKETKNLEKAMDAKALQKFAKQETGGIEVAAVEVRLELKLKDVTVTAGSGEAKQTELTFDITPLANFKDTNGTTIVENVPVGDEILNKEERFSFRIPVPKSITKAYAKVTHITDSGDEESIHQIHTDGEEKYIEYSGKTCSPFKLSFTDTAYTVSVPGTCTYTGSEICPEVTVKETETGSALVKNVDYTVAYEDNIQPGTAKVIVTILASGLTVEKEFTIVQQKDDSGNGSGDSGNSSDSSSDSSSGSSSGGSGGSSGGPGAASVKIPSWVEKNGTWSQDAKGNWSYTNGGVVYKNKWACVYNPYANTRAGQKVYDWFHFDGNGIMQTGWFTDTDGNIYYLNPVADGSRGRMFTGWQQIEGKWYYFSTAEGSGTMGALYRNGTTPDGYKVDANGVWIK